MGLGYGLGAGKGYVKMQGEEHQARFVKGLWRARRELAVGMFISFWLFLGERKGEEKIVISCGMGRDEKAEILVPVCGIFSPLNPYPHVKMRIVSRPRHYIRRIFIHHPQSPYPSHFIISRPIYLPAKRA